MQNIIRLNKSELVDIISYAYAKTITDDNKDNENVINTIKDIKYLLIDNAFGTDCEIDNDK